MTDIENGPCQCRPVELDQAWHRVLRGQVPLVTGLDGAVSADHGCSHRATAYVDDQDAYRVAPSASRFGPALEDLSH